jgi:hypothetical protein
MNDSDATPLPDLPRFEATRFRAGGTAPPGGLLLALTYGLGAAVTAGVAVSFVGQWFYLILLYPIAIGVAVAAAVTAGCRQGKVSAPLAAAVVGGLCGAAAMFTNHYCDYQRLVRELADSPNPLVRQAAVAITFTDYMDFAAKAGVTITGHGGGKGSNLGYVGSFIYWGVELLIAVGMAAALAWAGASEPFCTDCRRWKKARPLAVVSQPGPAAADALLAGELTRLAAPIAAPDSIPCALTAAVCPACGADGPVDVKLTHTFKDKKGNNRTRTLAHATYPGAALPVFEALARPPEPPAVAAPPSAP